MEENRERQNLYQSVELEDVLKNPRQFSQAVTGQGIETEGFYTVFERQLHSDFSGSYGYDGFGASYRSVEIFTIEESGILTSKSGSLRVHRKFDVGTLKYKANEIMAEGLGKMRRVIVKGDVVQGFPGEYYLDVVGSDNMVETKEGEEGMVFNEPKVEKDKLDNYVT